MGGDGAGATVQRAACHCGAVKFEISEPPAWVADCNCSICRRHGALWAYYFGADQAKLLRRPDPAATDTYVWGDRMLALHHCRQCGCVTHVDAVDPADARFFAVNARLIVGLDPATVKVRQLDNAGTGFFWTRSDQPPVPNRHGPTPPDDWR
jgi:hypothetical protein